MNDNVNQYYRFFPKLSRSSFTEEYLLELDRCIHNSSSLKNIPKITDIDIIIAELLHVYRHKGIIKWLDECVSGTFSHNEFVMIGSTFIEGFRRPGQWDKLTVIEAGQNFEDTRLDCAMSILLRQPHQLFWFVLEQMIERLMLQDDGGQTHDTD